MFVVGLLQVCCRAGSLLISCGFQVCCRFVVALSFVCCWFVDGLLLLCRSFVVDLLFVVVDLLWVCGGFVVWLWFVLCLLLFCCGVAGVLLVCSWFVVCLLAVRGWCVVGALSYFLLLCCWLVFGVFCFVVGVLLFCCRIVVGALFVCRRFALVVS